MVNYTLKIERGTWEIISPNMPKIACADSNDCTLTLSRDEILVRRYRIAKGTKITQQEELSMNMLKKSIGFVPEPKDGVIETLILGEVFPD